MLEAARGSPWVTKLQYAFREGKWMFLVIGSFKINIPLKGIHTFKGIHTREVPQTPILTYLPSI